ncbi:NACHT domain-containing protein [Coleofasciculus sp. FACHB-1120]|uniref:NACHT domain-containing protein n=1 Tax=Coleofasciculus sp. FACHB-1120 TaxID=2692783 RepID=UPI001682F832|nr:NACHT domain-containing protein [Coleofasciculus sp. FACHB-1120]MBD2740356.1 NACHT domain-containing protein [Coleofasciculus sp. FACHB-1120]
MTGFEPVVADAAIKGLAGVVIKTVWDGGGKALSRVGGSLNEKTQQLIYDASHQYLKNYTKRHGILKVKVLEMREPIALESVYTGVQFLDDRNIRQFETIDSLETAFREAQRRSYQNKDCPKQDGMKVAKEKQYLMVLGGPGAGKSTFLRRMGLEALKINKGEFKHSCIPVFIELKRFSDGDINIEKAISDEFRTCGFPSPEESTKELLKNGKLLILLDGLDEVPTKNLNEAIGQIQDFVDQHDKNRFIASCRTAAYRSGFRRFSDVAMADFDDIQIEQFINNWFQSEADKQTGTAPKCWEILQKPEHKAAKELAQTPLLLTFLCLVYDRSQSFPDNRSVLYRKALRILLEEWASEKRILQDEIYQGLHTELEEILLSEIAYKGFEADRLFFSQREVVEQIKTFLASNLNAPQHLDGEAVLNAIAIQQGILVERAEDIFSFSHLTLQEYLTAQYIDDHRQIEKLVTEHLTDQRWQEVFLLIAGLMRGGADELLLLMEKEAKKYINPRKFPFRFRTSKLQALLNWAEQATTGSESNIKPVGKRAIANTIAIAIANVIANVNIGTFSNAVSVANAIAYAYADTDTNAIAIAIAFPDADAITIAIRNTGEIEKLKIFKNVNFTVLIARLQALKAKIPDYEQSGLAWREFNNRLLQTLLNAFNLSLEMVNLTKEEIKAYNNYLYANYLVLQCKQAAVRVSPKTWEEIEERMLLAPNN